MHRFDDRLLTQVFSHLLIARPESFDPLDDPQETPQPHLIALMRVNSTFHDVAARLLYRHPTTYNLGSLLYGLTTPPPPLPVRQSKAALLRHVRQLHLVNYDHFGEMARYRVEESWEDIPPKHKDALMLKLDNLLRPILKLQSTFDAPEVEVSYPILPRLERLTISSRSELIWRALEHEHEHAYTASDEKMRNAKVNQLTKTARRIVQLLLRGTVGVECHQYGAHGPYSFPFGAFAPSSDTEGSQGEMVFHVNRIGCCRPRYLNGWRNKVILENREDARLYPGPDMEVFPDYYAPHQSPFEVRSLGRLLMLFFWDLEGYKQVEVDDETRIVLELVDRSIPPRERHDAQARKGYDKLVEELTPEAWKGKLEVVIRGPL